MVRKKIVEIMCLCIFGLSSLFLVSSIVKAGTIKLNYTMVKQEKTNWCWAASAENSVRYETSNHRIQKDAVKKLKGTSSNAYPNVPGSLSDIKKAAEYISKGTESYSNSSCSKNILNHLIF